MVRSLFVFALALAASAAWGQSPSGERPVLLDFWLPTCGPCRQMDPIVARLQQEGFDIRRVDGSRQTEVANRFGVDRYPTLVLLQGGRETGRIVGAASYERLRSILIAANQASATQASAATPPPKTAVVPAGFADGAPPRGGAFQVGSDLGPATTPTTRPAAPPLAARPAATGAPSTDHLLSASVRLRVEDQQGHSFGTGTIIDARQGEALVLTCAHLFRDNGAGPGMVTVEMFQPSANGLRVIDRAPGQVIASDLENDVALVSIRPSRPVATAPVASSLGAVTASAPAWSVGCDQGADPTIRTGRVVGVNRSHRPPNVSVTGAPVQGRSGGGLFNAAGEVVGVCFGADEQRNEGLYADLVSIHAQLDKLGLSEVYRTGPASPNPTPPNPRPTTLANAATPAPSQPAAQPPRTGLVPMQPQPPIVRAQNNTAPPAPGFGLADLPANERAALEEISRRAAESEVICIVRPKAAGGRSEVISLDSVSPAFLQALRQMRAAR